MTLHERFDTKINVQNLIAALAFAGGLIAWGMRMDSRVSVLEACQKTQAEVDRRQDVERDRLQDQLQIRLQRMEDKLDRLAERRP